jgi:hypothetical protein
MFMGSDREITQDIIMLDVVDTRHQDLFFFQFFDVAISSTRAIGQILATTYRSEKESRNLVNLVTLALSFPEISCV